MTDLVALRAIHEHPREVITTAELAAALGVAEHEAELRIDVLRADGYVSDPMQYRSARGEWSEIGVKLTPDGRVLLGGE